MSRIFEFILDRAETIYISDSLGEETWQMEIRGAGGLNQVIVPSFVESPEIRTPQSFTKLNPIPSSLDTLNITQKEQLGAAHRTHFDIVGRSGDLDVLVSSVGRYTRLENVRCPYDLSATIAPRNLERNNKAEYYLSISSISPKLSPIEVRWGTSTTLRFRGNIEFYFRDKSMLNIHLTIPYGSSVNCSYAQILPAKESLLSRLRKSQYAIAQVQP